MAEFHGAKIALFTPNNQLLVYLRDNNPDILYANCWDLPGGGRENNETPFETIIRETQEEFGIGLEKSQISYAAQYPSWRFPDMVSFFMVGNINQKQISSIKFGNEGQYYKFITIDEYLGLKSTQVVSDHQDRLRDYLDSLK